MIVVNEAGRFPRADRADRNDAIGESSIVAAVAQQRLVEPNQLMPRRDAQLGRQHASGPVEGAQRFGTPTRRVERRQQQRPPPLAQRLGLHEHLRFRHDIRGRHDTEGHSTPLLEPALPHLGEPCPLSDRRRPVVELLVRDATPQRQRFVPGGQRSPPVVARASSPEQRRERDDVQ